MFDDLMKIKKPGASVENKLPHVKHLTRPSRLGSAGRGLVVVTARVVVEVVVEVVWTGLRVVGTSLQI